LSIEDILRLTFIAPILLFFLTRSGKNKSKWVFFLFCTFVFFHALITALLEITVGKTPSSLFNFIFIPVEFSIIGYFFYHSVNYEIHKRVILWLSIAFIAAYIIKSLLTPLQMFDSALNGVESLLVIFFSLLYFYEQLRYPKSLFIYTQPEFWGVSGFFLFFSISFFAFLYRQTFWTQKDFYVQYVYIHALAGILRNLLFTMGMLIKPEKTPLPELTP
jgi:hypothetical protein